MWDGRRFGAGHPAGALRNVARTEFDSSRTLASDRNLKFLVQLLMR
jgi:hypothetical protein